VTEKHHTIFPIATAFIEGYSKKIFCAAASTWMDPAADPYRFFQYYFII
jgi:hypothetical protein